MSSNTWISVGVGIIAGVAGFFTGGATWALFAASIAMTATSMLLGPDTPKSGSMRPDELQINQSAEDAVIPVVFGTTRVSANFIKVDFDNFTSKEITQEQEGGKGGGGSSEQVVGYRYTVPLAYGICMGEIDALVKVFRSPGLEVMAKFSGDGLTFTGGAPEAITVEFTKKQGDQEYMEGGAATFYPGSLTQGSATTTDDNHRGVCWINFAKYTIDGSPSPASMLFEIRRLPKCLDDDGDPIAGLQTRASADTGDEEYNDANPAAVAWEVLQNPIWGKGMTTERLDAESFILASNYYRNQRIGMSTAIGKQTLTSLMGRLRDIFGLWLWWDGEKIRARCVYDRSGAYSYRPRIQADDIIGSPTFSRPSISSTFNEIRLEFTNRKNNWQSEVATAMDLAHVETVGGIRTQSMDGAEIGTRRAAELLAHAMLRQMAYPSASCQMKLRRTYSGLQPGSFVRFVWGEWTEAGMANTFWRVVDIEDDDQGNEGVAITLMEDIYATAQFDLGAEWEDPDGTIDDDDPLVDSDLVFGDLTAERLAGTITPVTLWEPNCHMTKGERRIAIMPSREKAYVQSCSVAFSHLGEATTQGLGNTTMLPLVGTLVGPIAATGDRMRRDAAGEFQIDLQFDARAAEFEAATGLVMADADHFSALTGSNQAILLIDGEVFRIGHAEETAPGIMTVRTYIRGELGTEPAAHLAGATALFFTGLSTSQLTDATKIPTTTKVNLHLTPVVINGNDADAAITNAPGDLLGVLFDGDSIRPFAPELKEATRIGTTWTIKIRPRMWATGAGSKSTIQDDAYSLLTDLTGLSLRFAKVSSGTTVTVPAGTSYSTPPFPMPAEISVDSLTWQPDDGTETGGIITAVVTFASNPVSLSVWGVREGLQSTTPLSIATP